MGLLIGAVARRTGLPTSALRYYEKSGLLPPPARSSKRRIYEPQIVGRIRIILLARKAGFSIEETKMFLSGWPTSITPAERWRALAEKKLIDLELQMQRLAEMRSILKASFRCRCLKLEDCEDRILA
jgi:MerR family transcriptional regulator, redox-sensitive transcriptional activator SoxR